MNTSIPNFYEYLANNYGIDTKHVAKDINRFFMKQAQLKNDVIFLLKCRDNNLFPKHIINNVKCTASLVSKRHPYKNEVNNISNKFKRNILNLEIKVSTWLQKDNSQHLHREIDKFKNLVSDVVYNSFITSQNKFYQNVFLKIKDKQTEKFENLMSSTIDRNNRNNSECLINLTNTELPNDVKSLLSLGPKFALPYTYKQLPIIQTLADVEAIMSDIPEDNRDTIRAQCTNIITNFVQKSKNTKPNSKIITSLRKTKNFLKNNSNIIVLKSDKTNHTVVMNKSEYNEKMESLLSDTSIYKKVNKDPTCTLQNKNNKLILALFKNKKIDYKTKTQLVTHNATSPQLYGLVKTHKDNNPMRPVVSFINSPTYHTAKYMSNVLKNMTSDKFNIKDSFEMFKSLKSKIVPPNHKLISLDVSSLFTNIPIALVKKIVVDNWANLKVHTKLNKTQFVEMLDLCIKEGYFQFNDSFFKIVDGVAMGSPIAPILADLVMNYLLEECIKKLKFKIHFIYKYVDDLLLCIPDGRETEILSEFNNFNDKLKFTLESENNNEIVFLDLKIKRTVSGELEIDWYRKPAKTDRYLNYHSHHSFNHKINTAIALKFRAISLSDQKFHNKNLNLVKEILRKNDFPKYLINRIVHNTSTHGRGAVDISQQQSTTNNDNSPRRDPNETLSSESNLNRPPTYRSIAYVQGLSEQISRKLKPHVNIAYKTSNTLGSKVFSKLKSSIPIENQSNIVYKIPCGDCPSTYIGQTTQYLKSRITGHRSDVNIKKTFCALAQHSVHDGHTFNFDRATILDHEVDRDKRNFKEMIRIIKDPNSCNKKTDVGQLSSIYNNLILNHT